MNEKLLENSQLTNRISNSFLILKRVSSRSINENKINSQKILYNSAIKREPLKVFNSVNKKNPSGNTLRTRLTRTITSYNHINKKIKLDTYNPRTNLINKRYNN